MSESVAYLDHAASTPMRPEAVAAMLPYLAEHAGNPSGSHGAARVAKTALEEARETVAVVLGARPDEIVFTAGGTEADNLAVKGGARAARRLDGVDGVVTTAFEHKGVLAPAHRLEAEGFRVTEAAVTTAGLVDLDDLAGRLDDRTALVSVMAVNNELGTIQPLAEVARVARERAPRARLHTDAVQAVPWVDVAPHTAAYDLVAISGHKFGGPKGVGALLVRAGTALDAEIEGGGQERGIRAGTVNVAGVVALATALRITHEQRAEETARIAALRDRLRAGLLDAVPDTFVNGDDRRRTAGHLHVGFPGVESEALLLLLDQEGLYAAAGSSCSSGATEISHVLAAMGMDRSAATASIRLSLGYASTAGDVDRALAVIPAAVARLRAPVPA
jgi:cysteine desulfurase